MSDTRTLKEANAALGELVQEINRLQEDEGTEPGVVTDYVLIYSSQRFESDGGTRVALGYAYPDGSQPAYRTLGLLDCMRTLIRHRDIADDDD